MSRRMLPLAVLFGALALVPAPSTGVRAAEGLQPPEQFIGFKVGADRKLARWDRIVEYMKLAAASSDRVRLRELGSTDGGQPFILLEISSPETLNHRDRYQQMARTLYFQNGAPTGQELEEIYRDGKVVVLVTCSVHGDEIGATQMVLELVHQLATDDSSTVNRILDNVILLLVPSANPDGQVLVTDWYNDTLGTPYEGSPLPHLYHPYAGHDTNRDMYMLTQKESQYLARIAWHEWFPAVWLDEHQMGSTGPRMFVMPAADPINPNVHPLIYRWNTILGQSQAAALEAAGKHGIIYSSTYTNFWQGALAWSGWWHNQIGLLTEVASARVASPIAQYRVLPDGSVPVPGSDLTGDGVPLAPPTDIAARTEYPRPWLGGRWTLRDIVDYERIATMALLEAAADRRETILRQIYEVNRQTVDGVGLGGVATIVLPLEGPHDPRQVAHLVSRLRLGGVEVQQAEEPFSIDGRSYGAGTYVVPMAQVFGRYAKDLLEAQSYPEVGRGARQAEDPYDVSAWSLGLLLGVDVEFSKEAISRSVSTTPVDAPGRLAGRISGGGPRYGFDYVGPDTVIAINRLLSSDARVELGGASRIHVSGVRRDLVDIVAREFNLNVTTPASATTAAQSAAARPSVIRAPRIGVYSPWTGGNPDEGWTRWVLEQYEFSPTSIDNLDVRRGELRQRFDAIIIPDQSPREIVDGQSDQSIRPEYRGGIGDAGVEQLMAFISGGGTLIALGSAADFAIDRLQVPVRDLKRSLRRDQHFGPGSILRIAVDTAHPLGYGMRPDTYGFYTNGPFFEPADDQGARNATVVARYADNGILASGWLEGERMMAGRAAVVSVEMNPGRVVLFGIRPQHRAQTQVTFPLLFNALYWSTVSDRTAAGTQ